MSQGNKHIPNRFLSFFIRCCGLDRSCWCPFTFLLPTSLPFSSLLFPSLPFCSYPFFPPSLPSALSCVFFFFHRLLSTGSLLFFFIPHSTFYSHPLHSLTRSPPSFPFLIPILILIVILSSILSFIHHPHHSHIHTHIHTITYQPALLDSLTSLPSHSPPLLGSAFSFLSHPRCKSCISTTSCLLLAGQLHTFF